MSEQLPQGVFWCWYYDKKYVCFLDREPHEVELRDKMGARTGKFRWFAASEKSVTAALFLHIFGIVPKPGEALKLDNCGDWVYHCPRCGKPYVEDEQSGLVGLCCDDIDYRHSSYHAAVWKRKTLEAKT